MKKYGIWASVVTVMLLVAWPALAANVSGVVTDAAGKPAAGIKVMAQSTAGKTIQSAVCGTHGEYELTGLPSADYHFALDSGSAGFKKGEPVGAFVPEKGLTLNWVVSASSDPIAYAQPALDAQVAAGDPFGLTMGEFIGVSALAMAGAGGVAVGAYGAAGGFSSGQTASPSK